MRTAGVMKLVIEVQTQPHQHLKPVEALGRMAPYQNRQVEEALGDKGPGPRGGSKAWIDW